MITFATNSNNDLYIGNDGNLAMKTRLAAVAQSCEQVAKTQLGELVFNTDFGMPNFINTFSGSPNPQKFTAALQNILKSVPNVISVDNIIVSQNADVYAYQIQITTTYGVTSINVQL